MIIAIWLHMMRVFLTGSYKPPREFNWAVGVILLVLTMLMPCRFYSCPHASTLWFGPFGISYSNGNGPCHNAPHVGGVHPAQHQREVGTLQTAECDLTGEHRRL